MSCTCGSCGIKDEREAALDWVDEMLMKRAPDPEREANLQMVEMMERQRPGHVGCVTVFNSATGVLLTLTDDDPVVQRFYRDHEARVSVADSRRTEA